MARDPYAIPPDRRPTDQIRREDIDPAPDTRPALQEVRAIASATEEDEVTKVRCPCCAGAGMVPPELALVVEGYMVEIGERR